MELEQARKRAEELRVIIEKNNRLYYDQDAPELEDFEYDALNRELKAIEAEYPELVTASSPTQHVGGTASSKFSKAKTVTVKKNTAASKTVKKLKANKKYYVKVRTYKKIGNSTYYSRWSSYKSVKTK